MTEAIRLDFPVWTPIAARGRKSCSFAEWPKLRSIPGKTMSWCAYPAAPMTIEEARALEAAGHLLTMSRHLPDRVVFEIRSVPVAKPKSLQRHDISVKHEVTLAKADAWRASVAKGRP